MFQRNQMSDRRMAKLLKNHFKNWVVPEERLVSDPI